MEFHEFKVYTDGKMRKFIFNYVLDGLVYLENKLFDYIIIDDEEKVTCDQITYKIQQLNDYCWKMYGYKYDK